MIRSLVLIFSILIAFHTKADTDEPYEQFYMAWKVILTMTHPTINCHRFKQLQENLEEGEYDFMLTEEQRLGELEMRDLEHEWGAYFLDDVHGHKFTNSTTDVKLILKRFTANSNRCLR